MGVLLERLIPIIIAGYCGFRSKDLLNAWAHSPFDVAGWAAFAIWIVGVQLGLWHWYRSGIRQFGSFWLSATALACTLLGSLGDLRVLHHLALAQSLAALLPTSLGQLVWLCTAVGWMPAFGYAAKDLSVVAVAVLRVIICGSGLLLLWAELRGRGSKGATKI